MPLPNLSTTLKHDSVQRWIYGFLLLLWLAMGIGNINRADVPIPADLPRYGVILIPALVLMGQIMFNSGMLWRVTVGLVFLYTLWIVWHIVFLRILVNLNRDYAPESVWNFNEVLPLTLIILPFLALNWLIWRIKPARK